MSQPREALRLLRSESLSSVVQDVIEQRIQAGKARFLAASADTQDSSERGETP